MVAVMGAFTHTSVLYGWAGLGILCDSHGPILLNALSMGGLSLAAGTQPASRMGERVAGDRALERWLIMEGLGAATERQVQS